VAKHCISLKHCSIAGGLERCNVSEQLQEVIEDVVNIDLAFGTGRSDSRRYNRWRRCWTWWRGRLEISRDTCCDCCQIGADCGLACNRVSSSIESCPVIYPVQQLVVVIHIFHECLDWSFRRCGWCCLKRISTRRKTHSIWSSCLHIFLCGSSLDLIPFCESSANEIFDRLYNKLVGLFTFIVNLSVIMRWFVILLVQLVHCVIIYLY
jgi:hypothetical protein